MDERADNTWTDGRTDRWPDGQVTDEQTDGRKDVFFCLYFILTRLRSRGEGVKNT